MSEPVRFLTAFTRALSTMALYADDHPSRAKAVDKAFHLLQDLQNEEPCPEFSFLGDEVVHHLRPLRELQGWEWASRLANAGVQRLEFAERVSPAEFEDFLENVLVRLTVANMDTSEARPAGARKSIRFGSLGVKGSGGLTPLSVPSVAPLTPGTRYDLFEEVRTVQWMHSEVAQRAMLPLLEAESIVRSLSVAMHGDQEMILPLLALREFDEYTTTHSLNVSVLTMALAEEMDMPARDVRAFGVAGLLHDLGKTRIPMDILNKPGKLSNEERAVMQQHTTEGARLILESDHALDLAATVAYEHHIMLNGGGYPNMRIRRSCHCASGLVHVCDVYDALRTHRPYRGAWEHERVLGYIEAGIGTDFDPDVARPFIALMRRLEGRAERTPLDQLGR